MKVLIITYYWPPAGGPGVQRWLKFVKYLRDFGVEPIVYTVDKVNYPILDKSLQKDIPDNVKILKQPIWEPNKLFRKSSKKTSAGFLDAKPSFFGKIAQYIRANYFIPDARKFWIKPSVSYLSNYLNKNSIDVVITTGPPHSLHIIGLKLKEKLNIKWIADFRDPWTEIDYFHQLPLTKNSIERHEALERQVLKNADAVLVIGKTMAESYEKYRSDVHVITNGYDSMNETQHVNLDTKFSVVHIGMMNADRNHKILWQALQELCEEDSNFSEDLQLKFIGKLADEVFQSINDHKLKSNVEFIDYVEHHKVLEYQKSAQVLLLSVNNVPSSKAIITGKIFEYLQAKRPILAIAPKDGELAEILKNTNAGATVDFNDKEALKTYISNFYTSYKSQTLAVESSNIKQYHRKNLTHQLAKIIKSI